MDLVHDFAVMQKEDLNRLGIRISSEWDDYRILLNSYEIKQRRFEPKGSYQVEYSQELRSKISTLTAAEQEALRDIEKRLRCGKTLEPFMSKWINKTSMAKSDFLLKNWNIYHLHLEKRNETGKYQNPNLLFFQVKNGVAYFIDIKQHPKGDGWFDKKLFDIIFDNWPWLLNYQEGFVPTIELTDSEVYNITKSGVTFVPFRNGSLIPTNLGVASSGNGIMAVRWADEINNTLRRVEIWLREEEELIQKMIEKENGESLQAALDYQLIQYNNQFSVIETHTKKPILLLSKDFSRIWR